MPDAKINIKADIESISRISIVPSLLDVICRTTGMGFAAIARVTEEQWVACSVRDEISFGLEPGGELTLETTICHEIRQSQQAVVIDDVKQDDLYCDHHTPATYGFQSYISVPIIRKDGSFFGTLCAIDPQPAKLNTPEVTGMFSLFADLISFHLNTIEQLDSAEAALTEERKTAELREQFIAILGHDLRNPVSTTKMSAELLLEQPLDKNAQRIVQLIKTTNYRMEGLIDNMLDFARGRLGGGITLKLHAHQESLENTLLEVVSEMQATSPKRSIETQLEINHPVSCDVDRIAQLFSNLLGNAISHGAVGTPIFVRANHKEDVFTLSVTNFGDPIPEVAMERLFQPFSRGDVKPGKQGLGLGLYIASEIARAHHGNITVKSSAEETCFTFQMPTSGPAA